MAIRILIVSMYVLLLGCDAATPENVIQNASLQSQDIPPTWQFHSRPSPAYKLELDAGSGPKGGNSLRIEGSGERATLLMDTAPFSPGQIARASVRFKAFPQASESKARIALKLDYFNSRESYLETAASQTSEKLTLTDSWQTISFDTEVLEAHSEATGIRLVVVLTGKGKVLISDPSMTLLETNDVDEMLVSNGGFEQTVGDKIVGWTVAAAPRSNAVARWIDENPGSGIGCLQIKGNAKWYVVSSAPISIEPDATYRLSALGHRSYGKAVVKIDYLEGKKNVGSTSVQIPFTGDWGEVQVETEPAKLKKATHVKVGAVARGGKVEACFDDLQLIRIDE